MPGDPPEVPHPRGSWCRSRRATTATAIAGRNVVNQQSRESLPTGSSGQAERRQPRNFVKDNKVEEPKMRRGAPKSEERNTHKSYGKVPAYLIKKNEAVEENKR